MGFFRSYFQHRVHFCCYDIKPARHAAPAPFGSDDDFNCSCFGSSCDPETECAARVYGIMVDKLGLLLLHIAFFDFTGAADNLVILSVRSNADTLDYNR